MSTPTFCDYLELLRACFTAYQGVALEGRRRGPRYTYSQVSLVLFFSVMLLRRTCGAKAQRRWLVAHPEECVLFGLEQVPSRWTLSRRWKKLSPTIEGFVDWLGEWAEDLEEAFRSTDLFEDKSLFKALGPIWHQKDRQAGRIPEGLRNLDTEATWCKSQYHGWVYGYAGHWTTTKAAFPRSVVVETASVSESEVIDRKAPALWEAKPHTVTGDNAYCNLDRVRRWAQQGIVLVTPALKTSPDSPEGGPYKAFIAQPENAELLKRRKTATEPFFDLMAQLIGAGDQQKQLPVKGLANVRTCLTLVTMLAQLAMIVNSIWGMPLHNISHMMAVCT